MTLPEPSTDAASGRTLWHGLWDGEVGFQVLDAFVLDREDSEVLSLDVFKAGNLVQALVRNRKCAPEVYWLVGVDVQRLPLFDAIGAGNVARAPPITHTGVLFVAAELESNFFANWKLGGRDIAGWLVYAMEPELACAFVGKRCGSFIAIVPLVES